MDTDEPRKWDCWYACLDNRRDAVAPPITVQADGPAPGGPKLQVQVDTITGAVQAVPSVNKTPHAAFNTGTPAKPTGSACAMPVFSQNDPAWKFALMQSAGDQIGNYGCALTSTAMVLNYYGANMTPSTLNACLKGSAYPLFWTQAPGCANGFVNGGDRLNFSWPALDKALATGGPAIVGMLRGQTGMHFVVVTAGGGNAADYAVTDPWDATTTKTLQTFFNAGYNPAWIVIYSGASRSCQRFVMPTAQAGVSAPGDHQLGVRATDLAGNTSPVQTYSFRILAGPAVTATPSVQPSATVTAAASASPTVTVIPTVGVASQTVQVVSTTAAPPTVTPTARTSAPTATSTVAPVPPTATPTPSSTPTLAASVAPTPTLTATTAPSATVTATAVTTLTPTATPTVAPTATPTATPTSTPTATAVPAPSVTFKPTSVAFGDQQVGGNGAGATVTVINSGNAPLIFTSIAVTGPSSSEFFFNTALSQGCNPRGGSLAPGAGCQVEVRFVPKQEGNASASLTFTDNAPNSPQSAPLSGVGVAAPTATPTPRVFRILPVLLLPTPTPTPYPIRLT